MTALAAAAPAPPSLAGIYESELEAVFRLLRRLGVQASDLEDAAHDVFVVIHRRLPTYDPARPLRPWVLGITCNVASHTRRAVAARREEARDQVDATDERARPEEEAARAQTRDLLSRALAALSDERRQVVVLHELEGLTMPQIAELVDVPLNTLYSRLRLARRELEEALSALRTEVAA